MNYINISTIFRITYKVGIKDDTSEEEQEDILEENDEMADQGGILTKVVPNDVGGAGCSLNDPIVHL